MLQNEAMVVKRVKEGQSHSDYSENTSLHCPVTADIVQIPGITINSSKNSESVNQRKVNWKKVNLNRYQNVVTSRIRSTVSNQSADMNMKIKKVSDILLQASAECAPKVKNYKPKDKKLWCSQLKSIANKSRFAYRQWKESGKPIDPENKLLIDKIVCKKQLTKRQRQIATEKRNGLYKEILISHSDDKKMFYK